LIELIESRKLDLSTSITHKVRLEDVNDGMQIVEGNIGNPIRVVVVK
jgi:Zn-dependent alcohol dehydrogenase